MRRLGFAWSGLLAVLAACTHNPPPATLPAAPPPKIVTLCGADSPLAAADRKTVCDRRAALGETDLPDAGGARVIVIPAGQAALSIRVVGGAMTVRRLAMGRRDIDRTVALSDAERATLRDAGAAAWASLGPTADAPTLVPCKAPNYIAAETALNGTTKFAVSHCVALKPLRDLADAYLNIASEKVPELKQGLDQSLD